MMFQLRGVATLIFAIPFFIGLVICLAGGMVLFFRIMEWLEFRIIQHYKFNREFVAFVWARWARRAAKKKERGE